MRSHARPTSFGGYVPPFSNIASSSPASSAATAAWLARRYPDEFVLAAPLDATPIVRRFMRQLRPQVLVLVGPERGAGRRLSARACAARLPMVVLDGNDSRREILAHLAASTPFTAEGRGARLPSRSSRLARSPAGRALIALQQTRRIPDLAALAENAYGPAHDRAVDLAIVQRALADYRGETVVIGDALADALATLDGDSAGAARSAAARS